MDKLKNRETALAIAAGFITLYLFLEISSFLYIACAVLWVALLFESLMTWVTKGWMLIAELMGSIMSKAILSVIFFLVLTPIALMQKLISKSSIKIKKPKDNTVYFDRGNFQYKAEHLKNPW